MKRLLLSVCLLASLSGLRAEVLDRIVAVVNGHIITTSDMRQEREILMRLGEKPIADDKSLVRHMVDNYLMETGIADFPGVEITDADIDAELKNSVALEGVPTKAVREAVRLRLRMRKYFDMRFRQYIQVSDDDVRKYYKDVFLPAAAEKHLSPVPPLDQVTELIRNNVVEERLNHEIDIWLEAIHRGSSIEIFQ
jgi:peptidyl-prolyl cis-trans isomerase SurA